MEHVGDQAKILDDVSPANKRPNGGRQSEFWKLAPIYGGGQPHHLGSSHPEFAYNASTNRTTSMSLFEVAHGLVPRKPLDLVPIDPTLETLRMVSHFPNM